MVRLERFVKMKTVGLFKGATTPELLTFALEKTSYVSYAEDKGELYASIAAFEIDTYTSAGTAESFQLLQLALLQL